MTTAACVHWFRVEQPNGEYSLGVCKKCGAQRQFRNYEPPPPLSGKLWPAQRANKGGRPKKAVQG